MIVVVEKDGAWWIEEDDKVEGPFASNEAAWAWLDRETHQRGHRKRKSARRATWGTS